MTASSLPRTFSASMPARGDLATLESVFDRCSAALYRFVCVRVGGDRHLADDLMQQLWIQARRSDRYVPEAELEYWLRAIARNLVRSHWRGNARRPAHLPLADPALAGDLAERLAGEELPAAALAKREASDQLLLALTELSAGDQELLVEFYFHEQPQAELARRFGLTERAIEGRLYRARQALREKLQHLE